MPRSPRLTCRPSDCQARYPATRVAVGVAVKARLHIKVGSECIAAMDGGDRLIEAAKRLSDTVGFLVRFAMMREMLLQGHTI